MKFITDWKCWSPWLTPTSMWSGHPKHFGTSQVTPAFFSFLIFSPFMNFCSNWGRNGANAHKPWWLGFVTWKNCLYWRKCHKIHNIIILSFIFSLNALQILQAASKTGFLKFSKTISPTLSSLQASLSFYGIFVCIILYFALKLGLESHQIEPEHGLIWVQFESELLNYNFNLRLIRLNWVNSDGIYR